MSTGDGYKTANLISKKGFIIAATVIAAIFVIAIMAMRMQQGSNTSSLPPNKKVSAESILNDNLGTSLQAYTYDPYGNEITTSTLSNYGFQGYEKDRESNLSYLRARYYDPTTGRFISRDPIDGILKVPESQNGYSYAHNDPVNLSDPSGEFIDTLWDAGNVLYDVYQCQWLDAAFDTGAAFIPFVPAGSTKALRALGAAGDAAKNIPGNPLRGPNAPAEAYKLLQKNHGIDPHTASNRLHKIKANGGVGAADNVVIGRTGDVYNERTGEFIGSLTDPKWGK